MSQEMYEQYRDALLCGLSAAQVKALDDADHDGFVAALLTCGSLGWLRWTEDGGLEPTMEGVEKRGRLGREVHPCGACGGPTFPVLMAATTEVLSVAWVCPDHDGRLQAMPRIAAMDFTS